MNSIHADILIVTATDIETESVINVFQSGVEKTYSRFHIGDKTYLFLGWFSGASVFLVESEKGSVGPGSSLLTVNEGIKSLTPTSIIMVGIAFGVDPHKQKIGDVLVSTQILVYETQRISTAKDNSEKIIIRGDRPHASVKLIDHFTSCFKQWGNCEVYFGLLLSGEKLIDNMNFRKSLQDLESEAIGGEMEGTGLYAAAERHKVDWIIVKGICDWADGEKSRNKKKRQILASENAASLTLFVITHGGFKNKEYQICDFNKDFLCNPKITTDESNIARSDKENENIVSLYMKGDYLDSYVLSDLLLKKSIDNKDLESATIFLSAMVNIQRLQGNFSEASNLYDKYNVIIPFSKLPPQYYLRVLKEKFVIAHETNQIDHSFHLLNKINKIDQSRIMCPPSDNWLPGVIFWREAHLLLLQNKTNISEALSRSIEAIEWYRAINSTNPSGLASALLNTGWLFYTDHNEKCLDYFSLAKQNAYDHSPRIYAEAKIGESMANFIFNRDKWVESAINLLESIGEIDKDGSIQRNYTFLGFGITPLSIFRQEFSQIDENNFEKFAHSAGFKLFSSCNLNNPIIVESIKNDEKKRRIIKKIRNI